MSLSFLNSEVVKHPNGLTPKLLTCILKESGALNHGEVRRIVQRPAPGGSRAYNRYMEVDYSSEAGNAVPTRLFLKLEPEDHTPEVSVYRHFFSAIENMPVPKCYAAGYFPEKRGFYLLLEDLSATHRSPEYGPACIWPQVYDKSIFEQTMDGYAKFHAFGWGHWQLKEGKRPNRLQVWGLPERVQQTCKKVDPGLSRHVLELGKETYFNESDLRGNFNTSLETLEKWFAFMGDQFTDRQRDLYRKIVTYGQGLLVKRIVDGQHLAFIQQDAKPDQTLYPIKPESHHVCITDWGAIMLSFGPYDLARHMCRFSPEFRQAVERNLVQYYYNCIIEYGVEGYDWDACWYDYRLGLLKAIYPRPLHEPFSRWEGRDEWIAMNEVRAFEDLDCEELF